MREVPITLLRVRGACNTPSPTLYRRDKMSTEKQRAYWRAARQRWCERHPDQVKETRLAWTQYNRRYSIARRVKTKLDVLSHYGPNGILRCSWSGCVIDDVDMLVLDHVNDNGAEEKRKLGGSNGRGHVFYQRLKSLGFPDGYQTLCCNHNHKKEILRSRTTESITTQ